MVYDAQRYVNDFDDCDQLQYYSADFLVLLPANERHHWRTANSRPGLPHPITLDLPP